MSKRIETMGFATEWTPRDGQRKARKRSVQVGISFPSADWVQFTAVAGQRDMRLSIPITDFFQLVEMADQLMADQAA